MFTITRDGRRALCAYDNYDDDDDDVVDWSGYADDLLLLCDGDESLNVGLS